MLQFSQSQHYLNMLVKKYSHINRMAPGNSRFTAWGKFEGMSGSSKYNNFNTPLLEFQQPTCKLDKALKTNM